MRLTRALELPETVILDFLSAEIDKQKNSREGPSSSNAVRIRAAKMLLKFELPTTTAPAGRLPSGLPNQGVDPITTPQRRPSGISAGQRLTMTPDHPRFSSLSNLSSNQDIPMRMLSALIVLLVVLVLFLPSQGRGDDKDTAIRDGTKLLDEGDKLADQGQFTEAVIRYKRGMEQLLPRLRKIPFKHEVKRDVTKREDMKALMLKEIDEDMTPEEFRANELAFKAFGLLPRDFNLRDSIAQVYSEEVAAFYDPKTKTMHLIEEPKAEKKKPATFLERLFGKKDEFDKDENKTVIAHELTHALADQNYDLDAMQEAVKKDDDRSLAISALIEGEATLAMMGAGMDDWEGIEIIKLPAENLEWTFNLVANFLPFLPEKAKPSGTPHPSSVSR